MSGIKDSNLNHGAWHSVGEGYVIENMLRPTNVAKIYPIDLLSDFSGKIPNKDDGSKKKKKKGGSRGGSPMGFKKKQTIEALWLDGGSGERVTSPYMRKGMKVEVYRMGTTDTYGYKPSHRELDTAKKDYSLHMWSNLKDRTPDMKKVDKDDHLKTAGEKGRKRKDATVFIVDQQEGFIELSTPNNDKEKNAMTYKIDMKKGTMNIGNSRGSGFNIDAAKGIWDITVKTVKITTTDFTLKASTITMDGETKFTKDVSFEAKVAFKDEVEHTAKATFNQLSETTDGAKLL